MSRRSQQAGAPPSGPAPAEVRPGAVSRLLEELARSPEPDLEEAWARGLAPGTVVGRFEILRELGRGGFGVVYEARDRELSRLVAFKAIRPGRSPRELSAERLRLEAEAAAQLNHPNIVTLHDIGNHGGSPYLILELLRGETLEARLARGPLPAHEAVDVALQVARGLAHAHAAGVVHRDLKPSNVFLSRDGPVKVLDFGLARLFGSPGAGGGTPGYMAPEQSRGEPGDARADVFAAAVMLHETLAGGPPFVPGPDGAEPAPAPAPRTPGVPAALSRLVARALSPDPAGRPRDGRQWLEELLRARRSVDGGLRHRLARAAALGGLLALAAGAVLWTLRRPPGEEPGAAVTVAVADFENATGERDLDGLSGLLITSLEQSRRLSVLTRTRMLDLLQRDGGERVEHVDERLGREISRGAGARALLLPAIRRFDEVYAIELKAVDPIADVYLFTLKEQGTGKSSIPDLIDRLGEETRRKFKEQAAEVNASSVRVASAVTPNLEAYQEYFLGMQCVDGLTPAGRCTDHFERAVAADPRFALAHYMLAYTAEFRGAPAAEQRAEIAAALRDIDRVPPKERGLILAWNAHLQGKDDEAVSLYRQVMARYPDDAHVAYVAGDLLHHKGDFAGALPYFERAMSLGASIPVLRAHVLEDLNGLGRKDEALARARAWAEAQPDATSLRLLSQAYLYRGEGPAAVEAARRAVESGGGADARLWYVEALTYAGDYAQAEAEARRLAGPGFPDGLRDVARLRLAAALGYQGRRREGLHVLEEYRETGEGRTLGPGFLAVWLLGDGSAPAVWREVQDAKGSAALKPACLVATGLAVLADLRHAEALAGRGDCLSDDGYRAAVAWRRGDRQGALALLRPLDAKGRAGASYLLGTFLGEEGRDREAIEALRRFQGQPEGLWRSWAYPQSLYAVARSYERLGDRAAALAETDRLLEMWRRADPDLPLLAQARELRRRLGG